MGKIRDFLTSYGANKQKIVLPDDVAQVYSQLYGLKNARHFAWCHFNGQPLNYQSMIIDIDVKNRLLMMDEPFGIPPQFHWNPGIGLSVQIKDYTTRISFKTKFVRLEPEAETKSNRMVVAWPAEVDTHQRRSVFRVSFDDVDEVPMVVLIDISGELLPCLDLSFQGIGIAVPQHFATHLQENQWLVIQLLLPSMKAVLAKLHIKRIDPIDELGIVSLGGVIEGVDGASKRIIDRFLVASQRKELKVKVS